jgi:RimJ/RimL family protein N-acetyltransferase
MALAQMETTLESSACWALDTREGRHVGFGAWHPDHPWRGVYEIDIGLSHEVKGGRWGVEATHLVVDHLFRTRAARKAVGKSNAAHPAAIAVMQALGAREEARLRRHALYEGKEVDLVIYGLLREEWERVGGRFSETYVNYSPAAPGRPRATTPVAPRLPRS